jgi:hypothetical protein
MSVRNKRGTRHHISRDFQFGPRDAVRHTAGHRPVCAGVKWGCLIAHQVRARRRSDGWLVVAGVWGPSRAERKRSWCVQARCQEL